MNALKPLCFCNSAELFQSEFMSKKRGSRIANMRCFYHCIVAWLNCIKKALLCFCVSNRIISKQLFIALMVYLFYQSVSLKQRDSYLAIAMYFINFLNREFLRISVKVGLPYFIFFNVSIM